MEILSKSMTMATTPGATEELDRFMFILCTLRIEHHGRMRLYLINN